MVRVHELRARGRWLTAMAATIGALALVVAGGCATTEHERADRPVVRLETDVGDIVIELDCVKAPISTGNFLDYARRGFYDGTVFHRVLAHYVIQGGGYDVAGEARVTGPPIVCEGTNGLKNVRYTVAMARTMVPDSATSQFFINVADNAMLDYAAQQGAGYAVFGVVKDGASIAVVDRIATAPVGPQGLAPGANAPGEHSAPVNPVVVRRATILTE